MDICNALSATELYVSFATPSLNCQLHSLGISPIALSSEPRFPYPFSHAVKAIKTFSNYRTSSKFNSAIVSGYYSPLCLPALQAKKTIYYCHTPPRFLFDLRDFYETKFGAFSPILKLLDKFYLPNYVRALGTVDTIIANSKNVQHRLSHYLNMDSEVIYPSIDVTHYGFKQSQGFYLSLARHENYKRIELIIDAFKIMPKKNLVIASAGPLTHRLSARARGYRNITFTGWLSKKKLRVLLSECIASIYIPMDEDFGLSPIESMASGKPVIGVDEGGVAETVIHLETGYLCTPSLKVSDVVDAVHWMSPQRAEGLRSASLSRSRLFDIHIFKQRMKDLVV